MQNMNRKVSIRDDSVVKGPAKTRTIFCMSAERGAQFSAVEKDKGSEQRPEQYGASREVKTSKANAVLRWLQLLLTDNPALNPVDWSCKSFLGGVPYLPPAKASKGSGFPASFPLKHPKERTLQKNVRPFWLFLKKYF